MVRKNRPEAETAEETAPVATPIVRGDLPEGFVTPADFAYAATDAQVYTDRKGRHMVLPQAVYSGAKAKKNPFPLEAVTDSNGNTVKAVNLEAGLQWFRDRAETKANAATNVRQASPKSVVDRLRARVVSMTETIAKLERQIANNGEPYEDEDGNLVDMIIRGRGRKPKNAKVVSDDDSE